MGRPKEHDESVRVALLAAAERLVDTAGPAALSVRAVADEVGTTTRAVYSLFGSKAGLLEALAIHLFELLGAAIDSIELTEDPAGDVVSAAVEGFRRVAVSHASLYNLVFLQVVPDLALSPAFGAMAGQAFGRLELLVDRLPVGTRAGTRAGSPSGQNAAQMVHALTEGLANMELRGSFGSPADAEATWRAAVTALVRGITE